MRDREKRGSNLSHTQPHACAQIPVDPNTHMTGRSSELCLTSLMPSMTVCKDLIIWWWLIFVAVCGEGRWGKFNLEIVSRLVGLGLGLALGLGGRATNYDNGHGLKGVWFVGHARLQLDPSHLPGSCFLLYCLSPCLFPCWRGLVPPPSHTTGPYGYTIMSDWLKTMSSKGKSSTRCGYLVVILLHALKTCK